ncbi:MAG: EAL domain-containing protein [Nitrosomonadales bacterium]|nr:EAL domain-containing protein [Nitrosomonadales bacterium]
MNVISLFSRLIWLCLLGIVALPALAEDRQIRIGILAFRSIELTQQQWQATADHLSHQLPGYHFTITPMNYSNLDLAANRHEFDFILTNPEHYITIRADLGALAVATIVPSVEGRPVSTFGGVIFTRADRNDINRLEELRGKTLASPSEQSLGGYLMQRGTLYNLGIGIDEAADIHFTGMPHDNVVREVLQGKADVGFVRTGVLEGMARDGAIRLDQFKVLNLQPAERFPQRLSTELFPEWPFAAMPEVSDALVKQVTQALLAIRAEDEAAVRGKYSGFAPAGNYAAVEELMRRLKVNPERAREFDLRDVLRKYAFESVGGALLLLFAVFAASLHLARTNRQLRFSYHERDKLDEKLKLANTSLERKVEQRTRELSASHQQMYSLLNSLEEGAYGVDVEGDITFVNKSFLRILGFDDASEVTGRHAHNLIHHSHRDGTPYPAKECKVYRAYLANEASHEVDEVFWRRDGRAVPVEYWSQPIEIDGVMQGAIVTFFDISERLKAESDLRIAASAFETQEGILITDAANRILKINRAFSQITGYTESEILGKNPRLLSSGRQSADFYAAMWESLKHTGIWEGEIWNRRKNGEDYPQELTITSVKDRNGSITNYVASFTDITLRKQAEDEIKSLAFYDPLTQLPNRRLLIDRMQQAIAAASRHGSIGALLLIDLDNFKSLNDTLGHDQGDLLLQQVARRLESCMREGDTVARLGGDEFVVLLEDLGNKAGEAASLTETVAEKIADTLTQPYVLDSQTIHSTPSIGITIFDGHDRSIDDFIKQADIAMYQAKKAGRNTARFFDPQMQHAIEARAALESELHQALESGQFQLHYQVQVDSIGLPVGAEALIRWIHPEHGLVPPAAFIPVAEETGLILPLGQWVIEQACAQLKHWQRNIATSSLVLSVNVSAKQFHQADFASQVQSAVQRHAIAPGLLKLELTESMLVERIESTIITMSALKSIGIQFSLDDFGTGYSSLQYLKRLPLDQIKIDQSFVRDLASDGSDKAIVRTIIAMSHSLNLDVIAEGVETAEQRLLLLKKGCRHFQGYLFGKPLPIIEFETALSASRLNVRSP